MTSQKRKNSFGEFSGPSTGKKWPINGDSGVGEWGPCMPDDLEPEPPQTESLPPPQGERKTK